VGAAARATTSGPGVADADSSRVSSPGMSGAGPASEHSKAKLTSVGAIGAVGVNDRTKVCAAPGGIVMAALPTQISRLESGSVGSATKPAGTAVAGLMEH